MALLKSILLLVAGFALACSSPFTKSHMERQMRVKGYSKDDPPRLESPTFVKLGIFIIGFYAISEQTMDYSLSLNLKQSWNDPRLKFKPKDENQTWLKFDKAWSKMWVPDTFFRNEKKAGFHAVTVENRLVIINTEGDVWYAMKISATLSCPMKLHKYPLDTQVCPMMLESFGYTSDVMKMVWMDDPVEVNKDMQLPQYIYTKHKLFDCSVNYTGGSFPCLQINFILQRNVGYFAIQVFFPTFLIVILSWVSFWISVDAVPARVSLGLLTVLTMTNLSIGINSNLPRVSYIKAIDIWMSACLLFVFSALCEYAFVNVASRHKVITKHAGILPSQEKPNCLGRIRKTLSRSPVPVPPLQGSALVPQATLGPLPKSARPLDGRARAERIDNISRKCFPLTFILFNVFYWVGYIHMVPDDYR
uniref:Putative GABA receptor 7 n=1 Tax=Hirudo verbana TaxID=311461 RepID=A0A2S1WLZ2_9ANNE|nr:putative GABA receptor 7 [Hirudo verbana]